MKTRNKVLSVLLAAIMVIGVFPLTAFAKGKEELGEKKEETVAVKKKAEGLGGSGKKSNYAIVGEIEDLSPHTKLNVSDKYQIKDANWKIRSNGYYEGMHPIENLPIIDVSTEFYSTYFNSVNPNYIYGSSLTTNDVNAASYIEYHTTQLLSTLNYPQDFVPIGVEANWNISKLSIDDSGNKIADRTEILVLSQYWRYSSFTGGVDSFDFIFNIEYITPTTTVAPQSGNSPITTLPTNPKTVEFTSNREHDYDFSSGAPVDSKTQNKWIIKDASETVVASGFFKDNESDFELDLSTLNLPDGIYTAHTEITSTTKYGNEITENRTSSDTFEIITPEAVVTTTKSGQQQLEHGDFNTTENTNIDTSSLQVGGKHDEDKSTLTILIELIDANNVTTVVPHTVTRTSGKNVDLPESLFTTPGTYKITVTETIDGVTKNVDGTPLTSTSTTEFVKKEQGTVTVEHILRNPDGTETVLKTETDLITGDVGSPYDATGKERTDLAGDWDGTTSSNSTGTVTTGETIVKYYYTPPAIPKGTITIKYELYDSKGTLLPNHPSKPADEIKRGDVNTNHTETPKVIDGFEFKAGDPTNLTVVYTQVGNTIVLKYTQKDAPVDPNPEKPTPPNPEKTGTVIITHKVKLPDGTLITVEETREDYPIGEKVTGNPKDLENLKPVDGTTKVVTTVDGVTTIEYIYEPEPLVPGAGKGGIIVNHVKVNPDGSRELITTTVVVEDGGTPYSYTYLTNVDGYSYNGKNGDAPLNGEIIVDEFGEITFLYTPTPTYYPPTGGGSSSDYKGTTRADGDVNLRNKVSSNKENTNITTTPSPQPGFNIDPITGEPGKTPPNVNDIPGTGK